MLRKKITTKDLSKAAQEAGFAIVGNPPSGKFVHPTFGLINLREISVKQAEYLLSKKYEFLKKDSKDTGKRVSN